MSDAGLLSATEPVDPDIQVVIKYSVEVGGLPVYQESYDVDVLAEDLEEDEPKTTSMWMRRLTGPVECRRLPKFTANLTEWLAEGQASHLSSNQVPPALD